MTRVLVCGGRDYNDRVMVWGSLQAIHQTRNISAVINGGATGADRLAASWAEAEGVPLETYPADWKTHGRSAGPIRNALMITEGKPDMVAAFPGGRGTADMVRKAKSAGIQIFNVANEVKP